MLSEMLKDEDNKYCVDCDNKGPRWASWNLGLFLCIRCAGIHRNLGVHISKVKSVNLDSWTPQQVASMQQMQNSKARAVYEAGLPEDFRRPQTDSAVEAFIRQKYEKKKFIQPNWQPSKPPDFPIGFDLAEEAAINLNKAKTEVAKKVVLPARSPTAPVTSRPTVTKTEPPRPVTAAALPSSVPASTSASADLLGLMGSPAPVSTATAAKQQPIAAANITSSASSDLLGLQAEFGDFTSASTPAPLPAANNTNSSDLFGAMSQPTAAAASADPGKMSTDSIMALFGPASSAPRFAQAPQTSYQQAQPSFALGQASFPAAPQHLPNMQGFGAPPPQQLAAAANNPFLADAGLIGGQQSAGLGGQLAGLNLNQGQQAPLWQ